jgi:hypothetical protein
VVTPLAAKKHYAAKKKIAREIERFYARSFPGSMTAPDVFWNFIHDEERKLNLSLQQSGENQSRINTACRRFVDLFKKACVRARKLTDGEPTGDNGPEGGAHTRGETARQTLEDAKRPEDYILWKGDLR